MWCYTINDNAENELKRIITLGLEAQSYKCVYDIHEAGARDCVVPVFAILNSGCDNDCRFVLSDAIIIAPDGNSIIKEISCKKAVIPGKRALELSDRIKAESVITYGMSETDSVSASSIKNGIVISVRRELVDLFGRVIEIQDIPLKAQARIDTELVIAATVMLLISGVSINNIINYWMGTE